MTEPCCPNGRCDFRPERVRFWLYHLRIARLSNFDPVEAAHAYGSPRGERAMGRGGCNPGGTGEECIVIAIMAKLPKPYTISDIQEAGRDVEGLARSICPHAVPECAIIGSQRDSHA